MSKSYDGRRGWTRTASKKTERTHQQSQEKYPSNSSASSPRPQLYYYNFSVEHYDDNNELVGEMVGMIEDGVYAYTDAEFYAYVRETYPEIDGYVLVSHSREF